MAASAQPNTKKTQPMEKSMKRRGEALDARRQRSSEGVGPSAALKESSYAHSQAMWLKGKGMRAEGQCQQYRDVRLGRGIQVREKISRHLVS